MLNTKTLLGFTRNRGLLRTQLHIGTVSMQIIFALNLILVIYFRHCSQQALRLKIQRVIQQKFQQEIQVIFPRKIQHLIQQNIQATIHQNPQPRHQHI